MRCGVILLAAGAGSRFGGEKLNTCLNGQTMYHIALQHIQGLVSLDYVHKEDVAIVSGKREILDAAQIMGFVPVENPTPALGISRSIRLGMRALMLGNTETSSPCSMAAGILNASCEGIMFMVCDQPFLKTETIRKMFEYWQMHPTGILRAACDDHYGSPVFFHKSYFMELMSLYGDDGGRIVAARHPDEVKNFEIFDPLELKDIDCRADLQELNQTTGYKRKC